MKCRYCNENKHISNFKRYENKDGELRNYNMTCNECSETIAWFNPEWHGVETYYRHNKEYCDREIKRILDIVGVRNGDELLLKHRKRRSNGDTRVD